MENTQTVNEKWQIWQKKIATMLQSDNVDITTMLFLIGVQELGDGVREFSKKEKQDLMHIATCKLLSQMGFYELVGKDDEGWPIWTNCKQVPNYTLLEQEYLLKNLIIQYLETNT